MRPSGGVRGAIHLLALLNFVGLAAGLDAPEVCPVRIGGNNYVAAYGNYSVSPFLPSLPVGTIVSNYGPAAMCGFNGTIVVGGPLSLTPGSKWYSYSTMIRQSLSIFLDWLNGERGGVKIGGSSYAMRFVWVDGEEPSPLTTSSPPHCVVSSEACTRGAAAQMLLRTTRSDLPRRTRPARSVPTLPLADTRAASPCTPRGKATRTTTWCAAPV